MTLIDKAEALAAIAEQMKDARRTYDGFGHAQEALRFAEQMLAATIAALEPAALPARGVGVKPLVWAETTSGTLRFPAWKSDAGLIVDSLNSGQFIYRGQGYPTIEAAKAAAQADYEARILAALEPAPTERPTATVSADGGIRVTRGDAASVVEAATILRDKLLVLVPLEPAPTAAQAREAAIRECADALRKVIDYAAFAGADPDDVEDEAINSYADYLLTLIGETRA